MTIDEISKLYSVLASLGFGGLIGGGIVFLLIKNFIPAYLSEKAKNLARKEDIESIHAQLKESTRITNEIKNDIDHATWKKQDVRVIKREKLEEYMHNTFMTLEDLETQRKIAYWGKNREPDNMPGARACMYQTLYLPEIEIEHLVLYNSINKLILWMRQGELQLLEQKEDGVTNPKISNEHLNQDDILDKIVFENFVGLKLKVSVFAKMLNKID